MEPGWNTNLDNPTYVTPSLNNDIELIRRRGIQPVFGRRLAATNGVLADVWSGTAATRPLPLTAKPMFIVSSSAADTFGISGAQFAIVTFIDEAGDWRNSDLLVMNGTNNVPITYKPSDGILGDNSRPPTPSSPPSGASETAQIFRVQDAFVVVALGATEAAPRANNLGIISVVDGGAVQFEAIPIGAGRSRSAAFHVPRGKQARLVRAPIGTAKGRGTAFISTNFGLGTATQVLPIAAIESSTVLFTADPAVTPVGERSDIAGLILPENVIDVTFLIQFRILPA